MSNNSYQSLDKILIKIDNRKNTLVSLGEIKSNIAIPLNFSLDNYRNFTYDQGELGSCTANAFCAAYKIQSNILKKNIGFEPSRLYFYYHERLLEGTVSEDSGANEIDGNYYTKYYGICSESSWPYDISKFTIAPPPECDVEALTHKISDYNVINNDSNLISNIKKVLYNNNQTVLIAISIYDSFETETVSKSGVVPIPNTNKETLLGGHELCLIGYNDTTKLMTVLNSWGSKWGDNGLCYIPYNYLSDPNLGLEFITINL